MAWPIRRNKLTPTPAISVVSMTLVVKVLAIILRQLHDLRKEIQMVPQTFTDALAKLGTDISTEIQAAKDAIIAAKAGDPAAFDAATAALNNLDQAVTTATADFTPAPPVA